MGWSLENEKIDGETVETVSDFISGGSKITADGDCSHEITLAPQFEKNHKMPPSRRDGGLLFLHGLESNPESSLQTPQEA